MSHHRLPTTPLSVALSGTVRVYATDHETVIDKVTVKKAVTMTHRGAAVIITAVPGVEIGPYPKPAEVALTTVAVADIIDRINYLRTGAATYSRDALRIRDRARCGYCGLFCPVDGTMDHILPKSRGGRAEWTNAVWACHSCNNRKNNCTPEEAQMPILHNSIYIPTYLDIHDPADARLMPARRRQR